MNSFNQKRKTKIQLSQLDTTRAGIDVGSSELFVCIATSNSQQKVRSFPTFTADINNMIEWLKKNGVTSVAMESTGVYWIASYEMLEQAGIEVILVNAYCLKTVPGRKTDVKDCQWIQQLYSYELLRASFRPENAIVELRGFVRHRRRLLELAATQVQLMQKALIQMNIQLNNAVRDIKGVTGQNIIKAILNGERDPSKLAELSVGLCRRNKTIIAKSLEGNYRKEHLFALEKAYEAYEFFHKQVNESEIKIQEVMKSITESCISQDKLNELKNKIEAKSRNKTDSNRSVYHFNAAKSLQKLTQIDLTKIPGIDESTAMTILSEIGTDMSRWPNSKHFSSWLSLCPGNKISGNKVLSSRTKPSSNRAATALRLAARTLTKAKNAIGAFHRRLRSRLGPPKAITATAHKLAVIIYTMLRDKAEYKDIGEDYYDKQYRTRKLNKIQREAKEFGFKLEPLV